jgi:16S rRNA G966 N2-methylase RsmD
MDNIDFIMESIYPLVNDEGTVVFEMGINSKFNDKYYDLELIKNKEYGIKRVVVYRRFLNE